ncbi:MAG: hypothetical protein BM564_08830 [Bacteroidetes bacterium MedPE-SWsnd-G2]|nr:MAG: hypothetical protein BM564_08830 [Bacteroidetes bacterium MedPE-SWsnd-G2]
MKVIVVLFMMFCSASMFAQTYTNKEVKLDQAFVDSISKIEYPYLLPIWGKKVAEKGFKLPLSAGIGVNYYWQESKVVINELYVGFNNGQQYFMDDIVRFNDAVASSNIVNVRPDFWILPFLNVYGIFAVSDTSTQIDLDIVVPTEDGYRNVLQIQTLQEFEGVSAGFGITPTVGVGGGWFALDMNFTWTDLDALDKPAFSFIFGPRMGKTFKFNKPDSNLAVWFGGFKVAINSDTNGNLGVSDIFNFDGINEKLDNAEVALADTRVNLDTWFNNLSPIEQIQNQIKYSTATAALNKADQFVDNFSDAVDSAENSTVQYSLEKRQKEAWNFLLGTQYQLNQEWMIRGEFGFLGSRKQILVGLNYRFGL